MREDEAISIARRVIKENSVNIGNRAFPVILDDISRVVDGYVLRTLFPKGWLLFVSCLGEVYFYKKGDKAKDGVIH